MDDLEHLEVLKRVKKLDGKSADQVVVKTLGWLKTDTYIEVVDFEEFKQIHRHQLKPDAQMLPENNEVIQMHHVHYVLRVVILQEL
jgi:hypothetical protein